MAALALGVPPCGGVEGEEREKATVPVGLRVRLKFTLQGRAQTVGARWAVAAAGRGVVVQGGRRRARHGLRTWGLRKKLKMLCQLPSEISF